MSEFITYRYNDCTVKALQMLPATASAIVTALGTEAGNGLLASLSITYNSVTMTYDCTFRYKIDSTDQKLTSGDYLVLHTSGQYSVISAANFLSNYTPA